MDMDIGHTVKYKEVRLKGGDKGISKYRVDHEGIEVLVDTYTIEEYETMQSNKNIKWLVFAIVLGVIVGVASYSKSLGL